ncbi:ATP-binding cassette domain-containing protein, partial [Mycobacterium tuberculosis]|nr:ATP-binding cassette domain-containing protein [Mycobacterium tuberculosis]
MGGLTISDLVVEYSSGGYAVRPIDGLSLDVAPGSLVILLGPSGCGKTTLLSCLGGILRPKSGSIKFDDVDITTLEGAALAKYRRDKVGIVFQAFNLVSSLTALENVMVPQPNTVSAVNTASSRTNDSESAVWPGVANTV